jgi:hypothetical protein
MTKQELQQKLENSLAIFLETGDAALLNWFIGVDNKYKAGLLNSEILIAKFWSAFVRNGPQDISIFNYLATASPDIRMTVSRLFSSLIETKEQNKYSTLLKIFEEKYKEWPSEIATSIQNSCIHMGLEIGPPNDAELLKVGLRSIRSLSDAQIDQISKTIVPRIASNDANIRNNALQLLSLIKEKMNNEPIAIQECIDKAKQLLDANDQNAKFVLDYLFSYGDRINLKQINQIIALIQQQLSTSKPNPINLLGLEFAPKLIHNYNRQEIFKDVIEFAKVVQEPATKELCKQMLIQFYRNLSSKQEAEIRKLFGDNVFKK